MKESKKNLRIHFLIRLFKTNKGAIGLSCFIFVIVSCISILGTITIKYIIDSGISAGNFHRLIIFISVYLLCQIITVILGTLGLYLSEKSAHKILSLEKEKCLKLLYSHSYHAISRISPAEFKMLLTSFIDDLKFFFADLPRVITELGCLIIGSIIAIRFVNSQALIAVALSIFLNIALYFHFKKVLKVIAERQIENKKSWSSWVVTVVQKTNEFIVNSGWINTREKTLNEFSTIKALDEEYNKNKSLSAFLSSIISHSLILGIYLISSAKVSIGDAIASISLASTILPLVHTSIEMLNYFIVFTPSIDEVIRIEQMNFDNGKYLQREKMMNESYYVENLVFAYGDNVLFKDARITFPQKGIVVIKAPNGAGKSTLAKILVGILPVEYGRTNIPHEAIAYLPQKSILFPASLVFNITLKYSDFNALDNIEKARVIQCAKYAMLDEVIKKKEDGYNHLINMNGDGFSGGEKRRICLARTFYLGMEKEVIILDEPEAGLDRGAVKRLKTVLQELGKNKLLILITHDSDLQTIGNNLGFPEKA
jgi:ABC-type bacteriocin/lantibiotic exporter with double-glycine peptidase domain